MTQELFIWSASIFALLSALSSLLIIWFQTHPHSFKKGIIPLWGTIVLPLHRRYNLFDYLAIILLTLLIESHATGLDILLCAFSFALTSSSGETLLTTIRNLYHAKIPPKEA